MRYLFIILLVVVASCKEKKEEAIDLQDIIDYQSDSGGEQGMVEDEDSTQVLIDLFNSYGIETDQVLPVSKTMFPDRFGPDTTITYELSNDGSDYFYHRLIFGDSAKTMNAFYNWIDCFGEKCRSFYLGEEKNFQKPGFVLLIGEHDLVYIENSPQDADNWISFHDSLGFGDAWYMIIEQKEGSRAHWYTIEDGKKIKFEK